MEPIKLKALLSVVIVASGAFMMMLIGTGTAGTVYQANGLVLDFGGRDTVWTDADLHVINDPVELFTSVCDENGFEYEIIDETVMKVVKITYDSSETYESDSERTWDFWVIKKGETEWTKTSPPYSSLTLLNYTTCAWAYCSETETPSVGADRAGNSIYGYVRPSRTVSLAPSITETLGALNAVSTLVATDKYSNYPYSVVQGQMRGDIAIVGEYNAPSYEMIMGSDPDMVYCDGAQYVHYEMSEHLRRSNVCTVVMYGGESIETILDNIYIIGVTLRYELRAQNVIKMLEEAYETLVSMLEDSSTTLVDILFALSPDKAPWAAGKYTYVDDVSSAALGHNVLSSDFYGWVNLNSEMIPSYDPSVIIIISDRYVASPSDYQDILNSLSKEWKFASAYNASDPQSSNIYLFSGDLAEMAGRPGPRCMQLMELIAMILHPEVFGELPRYIGDDYTDYLTVTKDLGFNV